MALTGSVPPAKGKRAAHQCSVAPDRPVASNHEVGPAELILHLFVVIRVRFQLNSRIWFFSSGKCNHGVPLDAYVAKWLYLPCIAWQDRVAVLDKQGQIQGFLRSDGF